MENCENCPCGCKPISDECVTKYSDIQKPNILNSSHYQKATDDIDDLIGIDCAEELCSSLEAAVLAANEYNETKAPLDPFKTFSDFLASKWLNIINNRHFKKWYANRLLWHWIFGASISELKSSGLVTQSNSDADYKNDFAQAQEDERKRMERSASFYAAQGRSKFLKEYWVVNFGLYSCAVLECGCTESYKCAKHCPPKQGIRMVVK